MMRKIFILLPVAAIIASCGTPKTTRSGSGSNAMRTGNSSQSDEVTVTGTEVLPILGRNENGIRADLEGTWVLQSAPGGSIANTQAPPSGIETRNETTSRTETINGTTRTTTTLEMNREKEARITPPQSSNPNMHVAEAPSLKFFGSNETVSGFTGCNKFSGRFTQTGRNSISFQNVNPSTKMVCIGSYDENAFMNLLRRVNSFRNTNGRMELMSGNDVLMVFSRK
jgi:heat shock protein HslJ